MIDRSWLSHLLQHLARKQSGSILTTPEPTRCFLRYEGSVVPTCKVADLTGAEKQF